MVPDVLDGSFGNAVQIFRQFFSEGFLILVNFFTKLNELLNYSVIESSF